MLEKLKASVLTVMLMIWSTIAIAQTSPGGSPGTGGTAAPSGTAGTTDAAAADGVNWLWIIVAIIVVGGLLYYFLGRGRTGTRV